MGCDIGSVGPHVPYCEPKCKEFRLVVWIDRVKAQCVRCSLLHEFTVLNGEIKIEYPKESRVK